MFLNRSTLKASIVAFAVSAVSILGNETLSEDFSQAVSATAEIFSNRVDDDANTRIKVQGLRMNGQDIPLSTIWTNEIINTLNTSFREVAIQPADFQQLTGSASTKEWENEFLLTGQVTAASNTVHLSVKLIDANRESVIASNNMSLEKTEDLMPLLITTDGGGTTIADPFEPDDRTNPRVITAGQNYDGHTLTENDEDWFQIDGGDTPQQVTVSTESDMDTYIELYSSGNSSTELTSNDDGGTNRNAQVSFIAEPDSSYYITVRGYDSDVSGAYTLRTVAEEYTEPEDEPNNTISTAYEIPFGVNHESGLTPSDDDYFLINLPRRTDEESLVTFQTQSNLDTKMALYTAEGEFLSEDDDGGEGKNARITTPVGNRDAFIVRVYPYDNSVTGPYELVSSIEEPQTVNFGEVYNGTISDENNAELIRLKVPDSIEGSQIVIQTLSSLDTKIALYDDTGQTLISDDDSGAESNAMVSWEVTGGEVLLIEVTPYDSSERGPYELTHSIR
ncbi:MAG: hypothetical protein ACQEQ4_04305 [Fibrobacterota bacterium]